MADVITGTAEVAGTIEALVSAQIQEVLTANQVIPGSILDWSSKAVPGMDRVSYPRMSNFVVQTKVSGVDLDAQSNAFGVDILILDQHKAIDFIIEKVADVQSMVAVQDEYINQSGKDLAAEMDLYCINVMEAGISAAAPDHRRAYTGASLAKVDILLARQLLNEAKVPQDSRYLGVSPAEESSLMNISEFTRVDEAGGSAALRNGEIGKLFGFTVLMSPQFEDLKTLAYHRSCQVFARQWGPDVNMLYQPKKVATEVVLDHMYGSKHLDSGKRAVLLGTA